MQNVINTMYVGKPVIVRADQPGVYAGELVAYEQNGESFAVILKDCRWLWDWGHSAETTAEIAVKGLAKTSECRFPPELASAIISGCYSIFPVSEKAWQDIKGVKPHVVKA